MQQVFYAAALCVFCTIHVPFFTLHVIDKAGICEKRGLTMQFWAFVLLGCLGDKLI